VTDPFGSGAQFPLDNTIYDNCSTCMRDYDAVTMTFDYRPSAKWDIGGNYVYSKTRGNYEGEGRNTPASGSIIGNYPRSVDQSAAFPYGYTDDDIRHRVRTWGSYRLDFGRAGNLSMGGILWYRSGQAWNRTAGVALTPDPVYLNETGSFTKFFNGRGNDRFDGFWNLDATFKYQFNFWRDLGAYVKLDILNVTNEDNVISFDTSGVITAGSNPQRWEPRRADLSAGTCQTLSAGNVPYPDTRCRNFGRIRNQLDYQSPRQIFAAVGLVW
jgi:hypothetical protein